MANRALAKQLTAKGDTLVRVGDRGKAARTYLAALEADPHYAAASYELAKVYLDLQQRTKALRYAKWAVKQARRNAAYHVLLADLHKADFRNDDAREHYRIAADLGHKRARAKLEAMGAE